jgi:hypothetical protein
VCSNRDQETLFSVVFLVKTRSPLLTIGALISGKIRLFHIQRLNWPSELCAARCDCVASYLTSAARTSRRTSVYANDRPLRAAWFSLTLKGAIG